MQQPSDSGQQQGVAQTAIANVQNAPGNAPSAGQPAAQNTAGGEQVANQPLNANVQTVLGDEQGAL